MIHSRKKKLKRILSITLLLLLVFATNKLYAKYTFKRHFEVNVETAPFSVEVTGETKDIYDSDVDKPTVTIKNNNSYAVSGEIVFNNITVETFELAIGETKELSNLTLTLTGLQAKQHDLTVKFKTPYQYTDNSVKVNVKATFTNVVKNKISEADLGTNSNPYLVYKVEDLVRFGKQVEEQGLCTTKVVKQIADLDFSDTNPKSYYNSNDTSFDEPNGNKILKEIMTTGTGFTGIGTWGVGTAASPYKAFKGTYDGNNKAIRGVYINSSRAIGLFNTIEGATIKNIRTSGTITTKGDAGSIVGWVHGNNNEIINCENWTTITDTAGEICIGGIVGTVWIGAEVTLTECRNCANMTAVHSAAGLVGLVNQSTVTLNKCYNDQRATIKTTGTSDNDGNNGTAGLVVKNTSSRAGIVNIKQSYNAGAITGTSNVGGLISYTSSTLNITSSYNTGNITGTSDVGGLVGEVKNGTTTITNSYSAGTVKGSSGKGGILGRRTGGTVNYSTAYYANDSISAISSSDANNKANGMTSANMKKEPFANKLGADFKFVSGNYPKLIWEP